MIEYRLLNRCVDCETILELRESKNNGRIRLYCRKCGQIKGQWRSKKWERKIKVVNGEVTEVTPKTLQEYKDMPYRKYLSTGRWKRRRLEYYKTHKKICFCCELESYVLHHLTYKRIGEEKDKDLIPLCEECHNEIHTLILNDIQINLDNGHIVHKQMLNLQP